MSTPALKFYQEVGRDFLARRTRALLADDMRLGKTWQAIAALDQIGAERVCVVCPAAAIGVWRETLRALSPARLEGERTTLMSYDRAREEFDDGARDGFGLAPAEHWDVLIVDESHFCKTPDAQRTKAVFARGGMAWLADRIWCLSGTPAVNHAGELWILLRTFGGTRMGYGDFCARYCRLNKYGQPQSTRPDRIHELRELLDPIMLRRLSTEVDMAEPYIEPWYVESSTEFLELAFPLDASGRREKALDERDKLSSALAAIPEKDHARWLQSNMDAYATYRRVNALLKAPGVYHQLKFELENGLLDKVVVWCYHTEPMQILEKLFAADGFRPVSIRGATSAGARDKAVRRFNRHGANTPRVFLGQIIAAGTAIDLSAAHHGVMLEKDWVPGNNRQALARMGGHKQQHAVTIRDAMFADGVDQSIAAAVERKAAELSAILD